MVNKLIFYNNHNNGDIHLTREFVKDIINKTDFDEYYFLHKRSPKLLMDIPNLKYEPLNEFCIENSPFHVINNETYVNTHMSVYEIFVDKVVDVTLNVFYDYFQIIYNRLRIPMELKKFYIPTINYNAYQLDGVNEYLQNNKSFIKVLVCNGEFFSKQSLHVDFKLLVEKWANEFPHIHFILTDQKDVIEKENIFYTAMITKAGSDLNEISYLSIECAAIIGRASGPSSFCLVKENLNDVDKSFIMMCNLFTNVTWYDQVLCNRIWINNYDTDNIDQIITKELKKLTNYRNKFDIVSRDNQIVVTPFEDIPHKVRIDFYLEKDLLYSYSTEFHNGIFHWIIPHGYYKTGMPVKCKFYNDETKEYLFQKIV